jgi:hypothetical protein
VVTAELREVWFSGFAGAWIGSTTDPSPDDPEHFGFLMHAVIGDASHDAGDAFNAYVCTPSWFAAQLQTGGWDRFVDALRPTSIVDGSGMWFVSRWDRAELDTALRLLCEESSPGPDWGSVAARIARVIPWEFDYRYDEHVNHRYGEPYPAAPRP